MYVLLREYTKTLTAVYLCKVYLIKRDKICLSSYINYIYTYTCIYTYLHTYIHTCIRTYVHTYIRTYIQTYLQTYAHIL